MKTMSLIPALFLTLIIGLSTSANAQNKKGKINFSQDMDTLGGNEALVGMATALDPKNKSRIVQSRLVDRNYRFEFGANMGGVADGDDSYLKTHNYGASVDFHFNPRWSVGVRYYDYGNNLTTEGKRAFADARQAYNEGGRTYVIPDIDYPLNATMGIISWYPVYGKTNLLDIGIAQFDVYVLAGGGKIELSSGPTTVLTTGGGVGFWLNQYLAMRAELRYQNYKDQIITGSRNVNTAVGTFGIGLLL